MSSKPPDGGGLLGPARSGAPLDGAEPVDPRWAQVIDAEIVRKVTGWLLPGLACPGCGTVTFAAPPAGAHAGAVSYGPVPGEIYAGHRFIDVLIHGWDLAKATGQDTTLPADLVEACIEVVKPQEELLAGSGAFGTDVKAPPGADRQTELLAMLGRKA